MNGSQNSKGGRTLVNADLLLLRSAHRKNTLLKVVIISCLAVFSERLRFYSCNEPELVAASGDAFFRKDRPEYLGTKMCPFEAIKIVKTLPRAIDVSKDKWSKEPIVLAKISAQHKDFVFSHSAHKPEYLFFECCESIQTLHASMAWRIQSPPIMLHQELQRNVFVYFWGRYVIYCSSVSGKLYLKTFYIN